MSSDEALYERLLGGDMTAFDALYERYERPLFGFIQRYVGDHARAEELFHEAFLAVLREGKRRQAIATFRPWIYRVARNLCLNRRRSDGRAAAAMAALASQPHDDVDGPASSLERTELAAALQRAVSQLPPELGELYAMRATGMSYDSVAEVLGIPLGTVKSRMNTMLRRLREEMSS